MSKVTFIKAEQPPFVRRGDLFVADLHGLKLLHVDKNFNISHSNVYEDKDTHTITQFYSDVIKKSLNPESVIWKPLEIEKYNQKLRDELEHSSVIICENDYIKEFISELIDSEKIIISTKK